MLIVCPNCATTYDIALSALGADGRPVRCARCKKVWQASADDAVEEPAEASLAARQSLVPASATRSKPASAPTADDAEEGIADWNVSDTSEDEAADPFAVVNAPSLVPSIDGNRATDGKTIVPMADDIESIAGRLDRPVRPRRRAARPWRKLNLTTVIFILVAILAAAITWRTAMVRTFPQTASLFAALHLPVNLRGLEFEGVKSSEEFDQGVMVLVVDGKIVNVTSRVVEVPRLRLGVRNIGGQEVYAWTLLPTSSILSPGESLSFRTRLASPPSDTNDVVVRFFNRRDIATGLR